MTLMRHIQACNDAILPGRRGPVLVAGQAVGWALPETMRAAAQAGATLAAGGLHVEAADLPALARRLAEQGLFRWRGEAFDVRADADSPVLAQIDRGAMPLFGLVALGVHLNGLVGGRIWVARRARHKLLDPGKLDHLVGGGVAAGDGVRATLVKEAGEEAGLPAELAGQARSAGRIDYATERAEGLRRDTLFLFDLELSPEFQPVAADGEVEAFELWPLEQVLEAVRNTDAFKFNVNLVLIDLFIRRGMVDREEAAALSAALRANGTERATAPEL